MFHLVSVICISSLVVCPMLRVTALTCGFAFDDVPSKTLLSGVVFEGRVRQPRSVGNASLTNPLQFNVSQSVGRYAVIFAVQKWHKGELRTASSSTDEVQQSSRPGVVTVGYFSEVADDAACVSPLVQVGRSYLVFLASGLPESSIQSGSVMDTTTSRRPSSANNSNNRGRNTVPTYVISSFPVLANARSIASVTEYANCTKCGRPPTVQLQRTPSTSAGSAPAPVGRPLELICRIRRGRPAPPRVDWFKDGAPLTANNRIRLSQPSTSSQSSRMRIPKAKVEDSGLYECSAVNVLGVSDRANASVVIGSVTKKPHSVECSKQGYCLNGGICFLMDGRRFCQCPNTFQGDRCQEKHVIVAKVLSPDYVQSVREFEVVMILCGIIVASLLIVAFTLLIFASVRRHRKECDKDGHETSYHQVPTQHSPTTSSSFNDEFYHLQANGTAGQPVPVHLSSLLRPIPLTQGNPDTSGRPRLRAISMTPNSTYLHDCGALLVSEENSQPTLGEPTVISSSACRPTNAENSAGNDDVSRQQYVGNDDMCMYPTSRDSDVRPRMLNDRNIECVRNSMDSDFVALESLC